MHLLLFNDTFRDFIVFYFKVLFIDQKYSIF